MAKNKYSVKTKTVFGVDNYVSSDSVMHYALHQCLCELYKRAQPSCDFNKVLKDIKVGKKVEDEDTEDFLYKRHYLSPEEFYYVVNKYIHAYNFDSVWEDYVDTVKTYLIDGGTENDASAKFGYKKTPKLKDVIGEDAACSVIELIDKCKNYYRFNRLENDFRMNIALGLPSPTSNKEDVIKYWHEHGKDIKIEPRHYKEDDFFCMDYYNVDYKGLQKIYKEEEETYIEYSKEDKNSLDNEDNTQKN